MNERAEKKISEMLSAPDIYPAPLYEAMAFAYADAAAMCRAHAMEMCEDEGHGGSSHYHACMALAEMLDRQK